jgi:hypothetical protein
MRTLLIDDFRQLKADFTATTYELGIISLEDYGPWDLLLLDHDLGEDPPHDGYGIVCWLEQHPQYFPKQVRVVSSNPVGRQNIERVLEKHYTKSSNAWSGYTWTRKEEDEECPVSYSLWSRCWTFLRSLLK